MTDKDYKKNMILIGIGGVIISLVGLYLSKVVFNEYLSEIKKLNNKIEKYL